MLKSQIKPGVQYAVREKRVRGEPFQRVRVTEHIRGSKWKAEWIEDYNAVAPALRAGDAKLGGIPRGTTI